MTWPAYKRSVRDTVEKELEKYRKTLEPAGSLALVRTPRTFSRVNLEWFVLYQFAGISSIEIAERYAGEYEDSAILKGVKVAARLLGWEHLREPKTKRNRKTR
jgi:hypothetical protein